MPARDGRDGAEEGGSSGTGKVAQLRKDVLLSVAHSMFGSLRRAPQDQLCGNAMHLLQATWPIAAIGWDHTLRTAHVFVFESHKNPMKSIFLSLFHKGGNMLREVYIIQSHTARKGELGI